MVRRRPPPAGPTKLRYAPGSPDSPSPRGSMRRAAALPWHHHEGPTLCFVLRGAFTETSGGERLTCTPDTLKVMPAGERHCDEFDRGDARGLLVETDPDRAARSAPTPRCWTSGSPSTAGSRRRSRGGCTRSSGRRTTRPRWRSKVCCWSCWRRCRGGGAEGLPTASPPGWARPATGSTPTSPPGPPSPSWPSRSACTR